MKVVLSFLLIVSLVSILWSARVDDLRERLEEQEHLSNHYMEKYQQVMDEYWSLKESLQKEIAE